MNPPEVRSPAPRDTWHELLAADERAVISQTPEWADCVCEVGRFRDASRLYCFADGRRVLVPLARRDRRPARLADAASWPFDWGIGGPLADGALTAEHTAAVYADLAALPVLRLTMRMGTQADPAWDAAPESFRATEHHTQVVDLAGGFDTVWSKRFRGSVRRAVRKAERSDLTVESDTTGRLLPVFDDLYRQSVVRWAHQQHEPLALARWRAHRANPPRKLRAVAERLGPRCTVWVARRGGEPAAAIIVLRHGTHAKYWRGAMNDDLARPTRANDLLHALAIEAAARDGCRWYHMGDSRPGSGLAAFKAGFGATGHPSRSYRTERLPLTAADARLRASVKRLLRFVDA